MRNEVQMYLQSPGIILITGSYGKTNCRTLICQILEKSGFSVSCAGYVKESWEMPEQPDFVLICASFFELKHLAFIPDIVVITNISSYPLQYYRRYRDLLNDLQDFRQQLKPGTLLIENFEYRFLQNVFGDVYTSVKSFPFWLNGTLEEGVWLSADQVVMISDGENSVPVIRTEDLILRGERFIVVYLAAIAAVRGFTDLSTIRKVCGTFSGHPEHFCCYPLERNVRLYMQLNTGLPSLVEAAFVGFSEKVVIVTGSFGEISENQSYQGLALMLSAYAKRLILFGSDADIIEYTVRKNGVKKAYDLPIVKRRSANEAIRYAIGSVGAGEQLIFSPIDDASGIVFDSKRCIFLFPKEER